MRDHQVTLVLIMGVLSLLFGLLVVIRFDG
jgi:hypothetical protein